MNTNVEKPSATELYQFYRQHRLTGSPFDARYRTLGAEENNETQPVSADTITASDTSDDTAAALFNRYRNGVAASASGKAEAIDVIMQQIEIDDARTRLLSDHFNFAGESSAETVDVNQKKTSTAKSLFELPGTLFDKLVDTFTQKKLVLAPAMALAVLAVLVVPKLLPTDDAMNPDTVRIAAVTSVPASLLESTSDSSFALADEMPVMAGFTSARSNRSARFHLGQLVTHAATATASETGDYADSVSEGLREQQVLSNDNAVAEQVDNLAVLLAGDDRKAVISALDELNQTQLDDNPQLHSWYAFGQIMESILISTELALSQDNLEPLQDSLEQFNQLDPLNLLPESEPLYRKIAELQIVAGNSALTLRDARQINTLAQSIRALAGQLQ